MPAPLPTPVETAQLANRMAELGWHGAAASLPTLVAAVRTPRPLVEFLDRMLTAETDTRHDRSQQRRMRRAHIGSFAPVAAFDWNWPDEIDRPRLEAALQLRFIEPGDNLVLLGSHGLGKTTMLRNIAHNAVLAGYTVQVTTAQKMLQDLAAIDSPSRLRLALGQLAGFDLLCIDELGYLSYNERAADLFYDLVNRRYEARKSIAIATNLRFSDWGQVFPNATCAGAIIERLIHRADIVHMAGKSWRVKEAEARAGNRKVANTEPELESASEEEP